MVGGDLGHYMAGIIAAVLAMMLLDCYRSGWRFVVQSGPHYLVASLGGIALLILTLVILVMVMSLGPGR